MRHLGNPGHRNAGKASRVMIFLMFLMLVEAIGANRVEVLRFAMVLESGATKVVKLLRRMAVLVA
jgi:hypothetical protein